MQMTCGGGAKLWPDGEDPVGRSIRIDILDSPSGAAFFPTNGSPELTVIGICGDTLNNGLTSETLPTAFVPFTLVAPPGRTLAVRTRTEPAAFFNILRERVRAMDALMPVGNTRTMALAMHEQRLQPRFTMTLFSLFAAAGLALAAVGLFSVLSYLVARRTREIGVRMALGARRVEVLGLILKDGGRLAGLGILIGAGTSVLATRLLGSQVFLYRVHWFDPLSMGSVVLMLAVISLAACALPARRAAAIDPMRALRDE